MADINGLELPGWVVDEVDLKGTDARILAHVASPPAACPHCEAMQPELRLSVKDVRTRLIMDVPHGIQRRAIEATVRRYVCSRCKRSFSEALPGVDDKRRATKRLVDYIGTRVFELITFSTLADEVGVTEKMVRDVFDDAVEERERNRRIEAPVVLGVDEVHLSDGQRFVVTNLKAKPVALIDMLPSRKMADVEAYFRGVSWGGSVEVVAMDMWNGYRTAVKEAWPGVRVVVDKFHVLQHATRAVQGVRKALMEGADRATEEHLRSGFKFIGRRESDLGAEGVAWLRECEQKEAPALAEAFRVKERLFQIYDATKRVDAEERLTGWEESLSAVMREVFKEVLSGLYGWRKEILAYFDEGRVTNAATEWVNGFTKKIRWLSPAISFEKLRAKVLYASRQSRGVYWSGDAESVRLAYGRDGGRARLQEGGGGSAGTDLERLVTEMAYGMGDWEDPGLWMRSE